MDIDSPEKSTEGITKEHGATLSDKTDLNVYENKEAFGVGSLNYEDEMPHDERKVDMNMGYTSPSMPLCEVNEGIQSPLMESSSLRSSFPVTKPEEMTRTIDPNPGISDVHGKMPDYGIGDRSPIKDHQQDEVLDADVESGSTVNNFNEIEVSNHLNNPLFKEDNDHYNSMDRECTEMHNEKASDPDEVVNVDCGHLPVNSKPENFEVNEERDYGNLNLKSTHEVQVKEGRYSSDTIPPENVGMVWEHSSPQSPQETKNVSPSERQLFVSAELSPDKQSTPRSPAFPKQEISSPTNFDNEQVPSPRTYKRRYSPSPEKHSSGRDRASQDRSSPSMKRKSPSDRAPKREHHHKDDSPKRNFSRSPQMHDSPKRRGRSASKSPMRRRHSPRNRREQRHSRSRSPIARDHNRRSPRKRSPRRRSPYHSGRRSPRRQWSPPANRNTGIGKPGRNLYIAGFSYGTTERDLERKFAKFGRVTDVRVVRERRSGDSRGFGFLSLERDEDADAAIRAVDQTEWNGRIILVEKSKSSARRS